MIVSRSDLSLAAIFDRALPDNGNQLGCPFVDDDVDCRVLGGPVK